MKLFALYYALMAFTIPFKNKLDKYSNTSDQFYSNALSPECIGQKFKKFKVISPDGTKLSSADLKHKVVFVCFWSVDSSRSVAEIPGFNEMYHKLRNNSDFLFVSITYDSDAKIQRAVAQNEIGYKVYHLNYNECVKLNLGHGFPSSFVLDKEGKIKNYYKGGMEDKNDSQKETLSIIYPEILSLF